MDATLKQRDDRPMLLDLTDAELATAATACRAMAYQEGERAKKMENPSLRPRGRLVLRWDQVPIAVPKPRDHLTVYRPRLAGELLAAQFRSCHEGMKLHLPSSVGTR